MTGTMMALGGVAAGAVVGVVLGWVGGRRAAERDGQARAIPPAPPLKVPGVDLPIEPTLDTVLRLLVDQAAAQVDRPCAVAVMETDGGPLKIRATSATADPRFVGLSVDLGSLAGRVLREGLPIVEPAARAPVGSMAGDRRQRPTGAVGVPVAAGPRVFGVLIAFGEPAMGGPDAVSRLDRLSKSLAPFLFPALEADVARKKAETDPLTDLPNRAGFERALRRLGATPVGLVAIDIDHFKAINDAHGHAAGDSALRHLGKLLRTSLREGDVAARIGGEEFAVILPGATLQLATDVAERLRGIVEARPAHGEGGPHKLTISCGVSATPEPVTQTDNLLPTADAALYRAKGAGRNCVVASGAPQPQG